MTRFFIRSVIVLVGATALAFGTLPREASAQRIETTVSHAILVDYATGSVLFEKRSDELVAPASMAKLMTAAVIYDEIRRGRLKPKDEFVVSQNAWRKGGAPSRGSSMFLVPGSRVTVEDLVKGLIVHSGNDAAIVLAEGIAGTEENFVKLMNRHARELGLTRSNFANASGFGDPRQKSTMRELALLAAHIIRNFPEDYAVYGMKEFTWNKIKQANRNPLLTMDIGADGLKTGNILETGYGLVGSAVKDERRLIVVVNGAATAKDRAQEARKLLEFGFRAFEGKTLFKAGRSIGSAQVYGGQESSVDLVAKNDVVLLQPRGGQERIQARIVYRVPLKPPIVKGQQIARLVVKRGDVVALDVPLFAENDVEAGGLSRRAIDAAFEYWRQLVSKILSSRRT